MPVVINVQATYLTRNRDDVPNNQPPGTQIPSPTEISLGPKLNLKAGDFVGLQSYGRWFYGCYPNPGGANNNLLGAVFVDGAGKKLKPAKAGQERAFLSSAQLIGGEATDIPEDFEVPVDKEVIVRIPISAAKILFTVNDSYFGDNCVSQPFGVTVFEPNRPRSRLIAALGSEAVGEGEGALPEALAKRLAATTPPEAKSFALSPFAEPSSGDAGSQWRGNYRLSAWAPEMSTYGFKRSASRYHWGWDIFAPQGSALVAPVWPATMTTTYLPPTVQDGKVSTNYGNTAIFAFRYKGRNFFLFYGHLDRVEGRDRVINGPEVVGYVGCTGLAPDDAIGCGTRFASGVSRDTRNDHLHVGLWYPKASDKKACDPSYVLPWKVD